MEVAALNQEKALVGAFSVITNLCLAFVSSSILQGLRLPQRVARVHPAQHRDGLLAQLLYSLEVLLLESVERSLGVETDYVPLDNHHQVVSWVQEAREHLEDFLRFLNRSAALKMSFHISELVSNI